MTNRITPINISKDHKPSKNKAIVKSAQWASGSTLIPEGVYMIPIEWNEKRITQQVQIYKNLAQLILGVDVIHNLGMTYLTETKELIFQKWDSAIWIF